MAPASSWLIYIMPYNLALQVEVRGVVLKRCESERQLGLGRVGVLECVPEGGAGIEQLAADFLVVTLRVLDGGYSGAGNGSTSWPTSLGDPDLLAA
jgi:hypothetical protein